MNQRPQGLKVKKAITRFLHDLSAEGLAPVTISGTFGARRQDGA